MSADLDTPLSLDCDLLFHCGTLLRDASDAGLLLLEDASASIVDGRLTVTPSLLNAGVETGSVLLLDDRPHQVERVLSASECWVSLPRHSVDAPTMRPPGSSTVHAKAIDFHLFRYRARREVLLDLHLDPTLPEEAEAVEAVANPGLLKLLEIHRGLNLIFSVAHASTGSGLSTYEADRFERRYQQWLHRARLRLDTNADGVVDERRDASTLSTIRR